MAEVERIAHQAPRSIQIAFWLFICISFVDAVLIGVTANQFDWRTYLARSVHAHIYRSQVVYVTPAFAVGNIAFAMVFALCVAVLTTVFAFAIRRGRNWARVLLSLWCLFALITVLGGEPLSYVIVAAIVFATTCLWLPQSNVFFRSAKSDGAREKSPA